MHTGELCALGAAVLWALATICFKRAGDVIPPFHLNLFKNVVSCVLFALTIIALNGFTWPAFTHREYGLLLFSGFVGITIADGVFFKSLNLLGAGRSAIVNCLYAPFLVFFSIVLLGEELKAMHLVGFLAVVGGALLAGLEKGPRHQNPRNLRLGIWLGALAMLLMTYSIVLINPLIKDLPLIQLVEIRIVAAVIGGFGILALQRKLPELKVFQRKNLPWGAIIGGSLIGAYGAMLLWVAGFKFQDKAATAGILNQSSVLFVVVFAAIFLGERLDARKISGALIAFAGVALTLLAG